MSVNSFPISHFSSSGAATTLKEDLIACWEFDETSAGDAIDAHTGGYDLTMNNTPTQNVAGKIDKCVSLNGTNEYINYPTSVDTFTPAAAHSISFWVYRNGSGDASASLVTRFYNATSRKVLLATMIDSSHATLANRILFQYYDSSNAATNLIWNAGGTDYFTGTWNHMVYVRDGSSMELYRNGSSVQTASGGNGSGKQTTSAGTFLTIGATARYSSTPDLYGNLRFDQTAIWGKALTSTEVGLLYNSGDGLAYTEW